MANQPSRRERLSKITATQSEHAGLWFERMLPAIPRKGDERRASGEGDQPPPQAAHIAETARIPVAKPYDAAFTRWRAALEDRAEQLHIASSAPGAPAYSLELREAMVIGRMAVGLGADGVLETAISLQRSYGLPQIPGSALKGTAAAYAHRHLDEHWRKGSAAHSELFGDTSRAGLVTFYDALYKPSSSHQPLQPDTITVHHPDYYQGGDSPQPPADWDSPTPIPFLSATGAYLIALEGPSDWVTVAFQILGLALAEIGVGAKTSSGYGRMTVAGVALPAVDKPKVAGPNPFGASNASPALANLAPSTRSVPDVGTVFSGKVIERSDSMIALSVPGHAPEAVLATLSIAGDTPPWRPGDLARVEVTGVEKRGERTILTLRRAPKAKKS